MKVYKLKSDKRLIGFRVKYNEEWYDISSNIAQQYEIFDKLRRRSTKTIQLKTTSGEFKPEYEFLQLEFTELLDEDVLSAIAVECSLGNSYYLMLKDVKILYFNLEEFVVNIIREDLLPFRLRYDITETDEKRNLLKNVEKLKSYFSGKVLSLHRKNAKQILNLLKLSQRDDIDTRCNIALYCKGLSLTDAYWVKQEDSADTWDSVNLFHNHLSDALVDVSLMGISFTPTTNPISPELTTKGLFQKAWVRKKDGLYMFKSDSLDDKTNTKAEVIASEILDCFNVRHCNYTLETYEDLLVASCKCVANEAVSMVDAVDIKQYCDNIGVSFSMFCQRFGSTDYHKMFVVDYILSNTDRHDENWGFYMDNETGKLVSMIPLYDHNLSLIADLTGASNEELLSNFKEYETLKEGAMDHLKQADMKLIKSIDKVDFMGYKGLKEKIEKRIQELGISH